MSTVVRPLPINNNGSAGSISLNASMAQGSGMKKPLSYSQVSGPAGGGVSSISPFITAALPPSNSIQPSLNPSSIRMRGIGMPATHSSRAPLNLLPEI